MESLNSLWRRLELLSGHAATMSEWRFFLGPCFTHFKQYIRPTDRLATQILCSERCSPGCSRRIVYHGPGDIVAVCPEEGDATPLSPEACVIHELNDALLLCDIGRVLGITGQPEPIAGFPEVYRLGAAYLAPSQRIPIIVILNSAPEMLDKTASHLLLFEEGPFLLIGLTQRLCSSNVDAHLRRQGACFVALDGYMDMNESGFTPRFPLGKLFFAESGENRPPAEETLRIERVEHGQEVHWLVNGEDRGVFYTRPDTIKAQVINILCKQLGNGWIPHSTFQQCAGWSKEAYFGANGESGCMQKQLRGIRRFLGVEIIFNKTKGVRIAEEDVKSRNQSRRSFS